MFPTRTLAAAMLLTAGLTLPACGGVSQDDYADDLDAICSDIEDQTEEIGEVQPASPADLSRQLDELRGAIRGGIERMRELDRPDGEDGEKAEQYVSRLEATFDEQVIPALGELEKAVRAEDEERIRSAAQRLQAIDEEETQELARDLGADECAAE